MNNVIEVKNLNKTFKVKLKEKGLKGSIKAIFKPKYKTVKAVKNISFNVEKGEMIAFIGPNGAGKSTTIKMLTGILYPDKGNLNVLGIDPRKERKKLAYQIGAVFGQKEQLWTHLTPYDNFKFFGAIYDIPESRVDKKIEELKVLFELEDFINTPVRNLSLGQRIRCEIAASTFGVSRFFFKKAFSLSDTINTGKLDSYLVQPKNVLLSCITTDVEPSAIGDLLYGYIMLFIYGFTIKRFILFTIFSISGGLILTSISVILSSLSFWFDKSDIIADTGNSLATNFATYPDGIFKGVVKLLLFTLIPVGIINYIPVKLLTEFNIYLFLIVILVTCIFITIAFTIFYKGLKRYSSSNLMIARL